MGLFFYKWSKTAASNANSDSNVGWAEGQLPSSVNDSARAMMASAAGFRDDISGATATGGTSTAYTLSTNQVFDSLSNLNGQMVAFTPHATNGATVTLSVDGLGAKPLRSAPSVELPSGVLVQGTPYTALYNSSDAVFYLQNFYSTPYTVPIGGMIDYWGTSVPNSIFAFPIGQAISRTTYATLFSLFGTTYGTGDGSTTFNVPDVTGRVTAMKEASATRLTSTYFGGNSTALGAVGGSESTTLTLAQLPTGITAANASQAISVTSTVSVQNGNTIAVTSGGGLGLCQTVGTVTSTGNNSISVTSNNTSGNPHRTVQPTIVCNKLLRLI